MRSDDAREMLFRPKGNAACAPRRGTDPMADTGALLRAEGLVKRFGDLVAVGGLDVEARVGEVLGFLGPNGAGKTTSIRMMCGLLAPDAGRVLLGGEPIGTGISQRRRIGVCPQQIVVWERLTCVEQLTFLGRMYGLTTTDARRRGLDLLDRLGLANKASSLARALSGGMQRRLNIALALVQDPDVVFLDEPEAGLDPQARVLVREFIVDLATTKAVILSTHNMDEAERVATRVAIIDQGRVLRCGPPHELERDVGEAEILEVDLAGGAALEWLPPVIAQALGQPPDGRLWAGEFYPLDVPEPQPPARPCRLWEIEL